MGSKREEERNEKIIRGLMKLPPNRRCINCNSLGPQYVCTNFWTFICTTCSGIHREFTHRVKSVSMAKFSFQEVDALQKGGNQRARELFLKAWDPDRNRLVDNSNIDKLRDFIKNVYVDKKFSVEKSSDRPPRDPQCLRNHEDEMRRASSYHSYSQSPPYDFQYEERRYGKHAPSLTRKPGSDRGLYEGKLAGFLSPNRLSDYAKNDRFSKEGSYSRMPDYCGDGGTDLFKSDVLSPSSQHESGSPFSETSRDISTEVPSLHISDAISSKVHPQRTASLGSFGSFDSSSTSFKAVHSTSFPEVGSELGHFAEDSHDKSARVPSLPQSSESRAFDGLDLFSASFAPQNVPSTPPIGSNFQLPESSLAQSVNVTKQSSTSSVHLTVSAILQPSALDLFTSPFQQQSAASNKEMASNAEKPDDGGWATFDTPQNIGTENSAPAALPSSDGSVLGNFNPFSTDQSNSFQASSGHEPSASTFAFETTDYWNTFDPSAEGHPTQNVLEVNEQAALHSVSDAEKLLRDGGFKSSSDHGRVTTSSESPPLSSLSSNFNITLNDFPMGSSVAGMDSFATDHTPSNPFDLPYDSAMESTNMSQFWNMSSLQVALPNLQMPATCDGGINQPWFTQNSVPSFVPGGVSFDSSSGSLGFIAGQAPNTSIASIHAQGPVASVGGNPFA